MQTIETIWSILKWSGLVVTIAIHIYVARGLYKYRKELREETPTEF